ncbi:MAG: EAL domain-containing protein, partial [Sphingomonadales bacterium]|nr:EAL domain-containing protein [Sphingomonadales bacterium]
GDAIRIFGSDAERAASHANRLEIDLVAAIEKQEIEIVFQPQVAILRGEIAGVEALARWRHPQLGMLGADALLAAAERADRLVELSAHIQAKALAMAAAWKDARAGLRVAVNVTSAEMAEPDFCQALLARIDESGFAHDRLTVEITESGLIADLGAAAEQLARLREAGLRVAIDDFGTGYSSLAYLKSLPLDYLKLDRRLSQDIAGGPRDRVVVSGVIEMARSLDLTVIAEGVETQDQLALLAEEGCDFYQGYLCSPPVDESELMELLAAHPA